MKKVVKIIFVLALLMVMLTPGVFAKKEEENTTNKTDKELLIPKSVKEERERQEEAARKANETDYNFITKEQKIKIARFVTVKDDYKKPLPIIALIVLILTIVIIKTKVVEASTKTTIIMGLVAIMTFGLQGAVEGQINAVLDVFTQFLGVILMVLANFFIYKHDNLLMYIPIYAVGVWYSINHLILVSGNILLQIFLIAAPVVLYILGIAMAKTKEHELLVPVKEKHDPNYHEVKTDVIERYEVEEKHELK